MLKQNEGLRKVQTQIGSMFAILPISANQWTIISLICAIVAGIEITTGNLIVGLVLFAFGGFLDMIDGAVARYRNQSSKFGGFLDGVVDRIVESIFLISFMFYPLPSEVLFDSKIWIALTLILGTYMPSFIRAYADHNEVMSKEKAKKMGGICERSERIVIFVASTLAGIYLNNMTYFVYGLVTVCTLSSLTIAQRIMEVKKESETK
ncbi:CDP-alcohol phosphatidyltransferase family protein [Candidatus Micrarchaeota archaeon]|nr:CDP-alcohol phosphatidyltransferase family protein [Candidatus Micrarchaeota archaeon]